VSNNTTSLNPATTAREKLHGRHPALVLAVILTCQLMVVLDATIVNIALPHIRTALGFSTANLSWVINAYTLSFGGLLLLGARAGDILGRRTTFMWGIALFTTASLIGGFSQNPGELLAARAAQGVGGALASPSALALLMTMFTEGRERTRAIGLYTAVSVGGSAVGLIAGGVLTQLVSWRWVLFVNVPIGIVVVTLARTVIKETPRNRAPFDLIGALTSTIGMASLVFGFVRAATGGWGDSETIAAFIIGIVLLTAFVFTERRAASPITPLRLFSNRNRVVSYLARLMLVAGMMGMFFFLTQFLQNVLGYRSCVPAHHRPALRRFPGRIEGPDRAGRRSPTDDHRHRTVGPRIALADAAVGNQLVCVAARTAGVVRYRERPGVHPADHRVARRSPT
jgi:EmrB/QacA subfamily drug resistance transporter